MALFAKKSDPDSQTPLAAPPPYVPPPVAKPRYGIADAIQLMRSLPVAREGDMVIHVVRATLGSLNVRLPDIIQDATQKQKVTQDRIAAVHAQIASLEKKLEEHRGEIKTLEADLRETTEVKERLDMAEKSAGTDANVQLANQPTIAMQV